MDTNPVQLQNQLVKNIPQPQQQIQTPAPAPQTPSLATISDDLAHINREMYKKNVELADRNKTLSILRNIDEIILSSVTDPQEIAQHVTDLLVTEAEFNVASILFLDKEQKMLRRIGLSESESVQQHVQEMVDQVSYVTNIPLTMFENTIVQSVMQKKHLATENIYNVWLHDVTPDHAKVIQETLGVGQFLVYPLIVRDEVLGAITIGIQGHDTPLSEFQKDLLNRLIGVIGIALDNALLYNEVQRTNEKLKALDRLKTEFVSLASHELRTPMTAIKSYLWMALAGKGGVLSEKQKYYLDRAYNSTDRLIKLVNDMLNISRIESGRITLDLQAVKIDALARDVIEEVTPRAHEVGVTLHVSPDDHLPQVLADSDKIKEVFMNLIGNSLKFTPTGGMITVSFSVSNNMVETRVSDTGTGIAKDDLPKLFHKFALIEGSYTTNQIVQGTGLGLYICRSIVELHGGKIAAFSEGKGKGAVFSFSLKVFDQNEFEKAKMLSSAPADKEKVGLIHTEI